MKRNGERKNLKKAVALLLAGVLATTSLTACGDSGKSDDANTQTETQSDAGANTQTETQSDAGSGELTTIRFGIIPDSQSQWVPFVDETQGFFAKHGIKLETAEFAMGVNAMEAIETDQLDVGMVADYAFLNRIGNANGSSKQRYLATIMDTDKVNFWANKEKIADLSALKGTNIATIQGTVYDFWNAKLFEKAGITQDDVSISGVSSPAEEVALAQSGTADGFWTTAGPTTQKLEGLGWGGLISLKDLGLKLTTLFSARAEWLEQNTDLASEFLVAFKEAIDYINNNIDEAADTISAKTGQDKEALKITMQASTYNFGIQQATFDALQEMNVWAKNNGNYTLDYNLADYTLPEAAKKAFPDNTNYAG